MSMDYWFMSKKDEAAKTNPLIVMVNESSTERYARATGRKGVGQENEMMWLVKDMSEELKMWGHQGGQGGHIIMKSDKEPALIALRDQLAKYHGGVVVPQSPPRNESQSNGLVEESARVVHQSV